MHEKDWALAETALRDHLTRSAGVVIDLFLSQFHENLHDTLREGVPMKIIKAEAFNIHFISNMVRDGEGHSHPGKPHDALWPMFVITCDDGTEGYAIGGRMEVDILNSVVAPAIIGEDPLMREKIWQRMRTWQRLHPAFTDRTLNALDLALWDIAGKTAGQPVYKLLGGYRHEVPAYGSIMVGDNIPGGLDTPQAYADYALKLVERGYKAIKLHTWMPPLIPKADPVLDIQACRMVREAVGPDIALMLDPYHDYSRQEAYYLAKELEKLDFSGLKNRWMKTPSLLPVASGENQAGDLRSGNCRWKSSKPGNVGYCQCSGYR